MADPSTYPLRQPPGLRDWMKQRQNEVKSELNAISIGTINSFDPDTQTAVIQVNFRRKVIGGNPVDGTNQATDRIVDYPLLVNCPVFFLFGGVARITMPITAGDTCLILFCDRDIDTWFKSGNIDIPNSDRMHDLNDGIALVGIKSLRDVINDYNETGPEIMNGLAVIAVEEKIRLQVGIVTLKTALDLLMAALLTWVDTNGDSPNPGTVAALTAAKTAIDVVLK